MIQGVHHDASGSRSRVIGELAARRNSTSLFKLRAAAP